MDIKVRGTSYHVKTYQKNANLPTLVILHGFLGSGKAFKPLIQSLTPFCNPVTIDLLGHGNTKGAELHYRFSTKEQVADLVKLIGEQLRAPLFLYGYSMGARLALHIALSRPDLLEGLILESGTFGIEHETERQARQSHDASLADQIVGNYRSFLMSWRDKPLFQSGSNFEFLTQIQDRQNPVWMSNTLLGFGTGTMPCVRLQLPNLTSPTQLIVGELDSKFVRINQILKKEIPDSYFAIVPNSNHRVHLDQPAKCAHLIKDFIHKHRLP